MEVSLSLSRSLALNPTHRHRPPTIALLELIWKSFAADGHALKLRPLLRLSVRACVCVCVCMCYTSCTGVFCFFCPTTVWVRLSSHCCLIGQRQNGRGQWADRPVRWLLVLFVFRFFVCVCVCVFVFVHFFPQTFLCRWGRARFFFVHLTSPSLQSIRFVYTLIEWSRVVCVRV